MPVAPLSGVDLYYEVHGDLDAGVVPLLLVAGFASDSQSWLPVRQALAAGRPLILPDNRGSGRTVFTGRTQGRAQGRDISVRAMAEDCAALLDHLGVSRVHVLGHSLGGYIAQDLALRWPELVDGLVLAATTAHCSPRSRELVQGWAADLEAGMDWAPWYREVFQWIFTKRLLDNPAQLDVAVQYAVDYPYPSTLEDVRAQARAILDFDRRVDLPGLQARTLVLCGAEDILFPPEESRELEAIPGARTEIVNGAAHSIHMEQPEAFVRSVLGFLDQS